MPQSNSTSRTIDSVRINGYIFAHDSPKNSYQDQATLQLDDTFKNATASNPENAEGENQSKPKHAFKPGLTGEVVDHNLIDQIMSVPMRGALPNE